MALAFTTPNGRGQYTWLHWKKKNYNIAQVWFPGQYCSLCTMPWTTHKLSVSGLGDSCQRPSQGCPHPAPLQPLTRAAWHLLQRVSTYRKALVGQSWCDGSLCSMHFQNTGSPHIPMSQLPICEMQVRPSSSLAWLGTGHWKDTKCSDTMILGLKKKEDRKKVYLLRILFKKYKYLLNYSNSLIAVLSCFTD